MPVDGKIFSHYAHITHKHFHAKLNVSVVFTCLSIEPTFFTRACVPLLCVFAGIGVRWQQHGRISFRMAHIVRRRADTRSHMRRHNNRFAVFTRECICGRRHSARVYLLISRSSRNEMSISHACARACRMRLTRQRLWEQ